MGHMIPLQQSSPSKAASDLFGTIVAASAKIPTIAISFRIAPFG
jgi:hypothetical protein